MITKTVSSSKQAEGVKGHRMNVAVILAGGIGSRVGESIPKQFIEVLGKPVLAYTIEAFQRHADIDAIEIVCIESYLDYLEDMVNRYHFDKVKWIAPGGDTFQQSVINGIDHLDQKIAEDAIVLIHFGASPFVEGDIIADAIRVCEQHDACTSAVPYFLLSATKGDGIKTTEWVDRDNLMCMNSPHAFRYGYIKDIFAEAREKDLLDKVEPHTTSLVLALGKPLYFSKGSQTNIKITTEEDLRLFEGYLLMKKWRKGELHLSGEC